MHCSDHYLSVFHKYWLGGDTTVPSGLYATFCHAFLVINRLLLLLYRVNARRAVLTAGWCVVCKTTWRRGLTKTRSSSAYSTTTTTTSRHVRSRTSTAPSRSSSACRCSRSLKWSVTAAFTRRSGLAKVLNVDWYRRRPMAAGFIACYRDGGVGFHGAQMLAPSAFLASAASTHALQQSILPDSINSLEDPSVASIESKWSSLAGPAQQLIASDERTENIQKEWDKLVAENHQAQLFLRAVSDLDEAGLLAASSPHWGDWLHVPPIASVGLRLSDEAIRVAHRLGCKACEPHTCTCGKAVDARDLHDLSCHRSGPRQHRHHQMNDILCRAIKWAQIPAVKQPVSLLHRDGKRPDGTTLMILWARGKPMAWDVTVPDTLPNGT